MLVTGKRVEEPFDDEDREVACAFIRDTEKPCIAYKILAASRKRGSQAEIHEAFCYAFDNIKPRDVVNVGMFQKHMDQVGMNARAVREILSGEDGHGIPQESQ
jgi:hypothetical protein